MQLDISSTSTKIIKEFDLVLKLPPKQVTSLGIP